MQNLYRYFPVSAAVEPGNPKKFAITIAIYLAACIILGVLDKILGWIPLAGVLLSLVFSLLGIYCLIGMIRAILRFVKR